MLHPSVRLHQSAWPGKPTPIQALRFGNEDKKPEVPPPTEAPKGLLDHVRGFVDRLGAHNQMPPPVDPYEAIPDDYQVGSFIDYGFYNSDGKVITGKEILNYFLQNLRHIDGKHADPDYTEAQLPNIHKKYGRNTRSSNIADLMTTKYVQELHEHFNFSPEGHRLSKMYRLMMQLNLLHGRIDLEKGGWVLYLTDHAKEVAKIANMAPNRRDTYLKTHYVEALNELIKTGKSDKVPAHIAKQPVDIQRTYLEDHISKGKWRERPNYLSGASEGEPTPDGKKTLTKETVSMSRTLKVCGGMLLGIIGLSALIASVKPQTPNTPSPAVTAPARGVSGSSKPVTTPTPSPTKASAPQAKPTTTAAPATANTDTGNSFKDVTSVLKAFQENRLKRYANEINHENGFFTFEFETPALGQGRGVTQGKKMTLAGLNSSERAQLRNGLEQQKINVNSLEKTSKTPLDPMWVLGGGLMLMFAMQLLMQHRQGKAATEAMKNLPQQHKEMMSIGKHTGYLLDKELTERFSDVGGNYLAKEELQDYLGKLKRKMAGENIDMPKGMAMEGPPGTGKTLLARALAGEAGVPFFALNGSDFVQMFVGVGASRVKDLFKAAREEAGKHGASIIFIDEIDSIGKTRSSGGAQSDSEREATLNALLAEMDGFQQSDNVFVLCATNRYDLLDPALKRPGRFTYNLNIPHPRSDQERSEILSVHIKRRSEKSGVTTNLDAILPALSALCRNSSGADLMQVVSNAFDIVSAQERKEITFEDFVEGFQNHMFGKRPKIQVPVSQRERQVVGHHEHGHGITGMAVGLPPLIISMFERFKSGHSSQGRVFTDPRVQDERMKSFGDYMGKLMMITGGHAAEYQAFGAKGMSTGWSSDLEQLRDLLRHMMSLGMFGNQFARDISDKRTDLTESEAAFMNLKISQALSTAIEVIEKVGPEKMQNITDLSLAMPKELVGDAAPTFYEEHLGPELLSEIQAIGKTYIDTMAEEAVFQKPAKTPPAHSVPISAV